MSRGSRGSGKSRQPYRPTPGADPAGQDALVILSELLPYVEAWHDGLKDRFGRDRRDVNAQLAVARLSGLIERGRKALQKAGYVSVQPTIVAKP